MNKERLWTKEFIILTAISFFLSLIFYLLFVTIGIFASDQFHVTASINGMITGIFIIGSLIGRLITGRFITVLGNKALLIGGSAFFLIISGLYFVSTNVPILLIVRLLHGFGYGIAITAAATIIAQIIPANRRGEGISYFSMSSVLGTAIGPFCGILLSKYTNFNTIFGICSLLALISLIIAFLIKDPLIKLAEEEQESEVKKFFLLNYFEPAALPISIVMLIVGFAWSGVNAFISLYAKEINLVEAASVFFIVHSAMILISRPFVGRLIDKRGANIVAYPCFPTLAIGMFIISQANSSQILLLAGVFTGLGFGNFISTAQVIAIKNAVPQRMGIATATFFIFAELGLGLGPSVLGVLVPLIGYRGLYLSMVFVIIACTVLYHFLQGKKEKKPFQTL